MMNRISLFFFINGVMSIVILASLQAAVYKRKIKNTNIVNGNIFNNRYGNRFTVVQMGDDSI